MIYLTKIVVKNRVLINKWVRWYFSNLDSYYSKTESFLNKHFLLIKGKKRYRNLLYYKLPKKYEGKDKNFYKPILFFSKNRKKPDLFLQMERYNPAVEKEISSFLKKKVKVKSKESGIYYLIEFNDNIEINKRKLCEAYGVDYDTLHYKIAKIARPNGTIMFFKNGVKFLSYPNMEAIEKEEKYVIKLLKNNLV